jgi:hypothetical protein
MYWYPNKLFKKTITRKKRNKENDSFYRQRCVKVMENITNSENNIELLLLDIWNLGDG